ncbi:hypothetical protein [Fluviispira multicolorata]|uniref:CAAX protease self-immunity n=1 Tax=Fluviispira multicolorata TaxID=2654512 RepID=A0A833N2Y7_9BACT|nr:hypothetical protein [Fluviispira multicolorata]KAB8033383.1 hypothetical protein GCL57_01400 [Fluviispira multicolorata]
MKNSQQIIKTEWQRKKDKYLIASILFVVTSISITWFIQFLFNAIFAKNYLILAKFLIISWIPFLISISICVAFKLPMNVFIILPQKSKKVMWSLLIPSLVASIALYLSQYMLTLSIEEPSLAMAMAGDHVASALFLLFSSWFPVVIFCFMISVGIEIALRGFFIEVCKRASIPLPWFIAGLVQFLILLPFLWFGYIGGGPQNIRYIICWFFLQISLSAFYFWLSLSEDKTNLQINKANRSLISVLLAASTQNIVYYVIASHFVIESGYWWMSGPANVIAVVLYFLITIFLLTTKRLKY